MKIDAIIFDADGTLLEVENPYLSIAESLNCREEIVKLVNDYLSGQLSYMELVNLEAETFIKKYKQIYKEHPRIGDLERFFHPPKLRSGVDDVIKTLSDKHISIFVLSSGFFYLVKDLFQLDIIRKNIYSNRLTYDTEGDFMGFKINVEGEKIHAFGKIVDENNLKIENVAYVGDNAFDLKLARFILKNEGRVFLCKQAEKEFQIKNFPKSVNMKLVTSLTEIIFFLNNS